MYQIKAHNSKGNVPFSWEKKPGVSKVKQEDEFIVKLPPPPCPIESGRVSTQEINIPLPPCTFQPPFRSSSRKGDDDPFFAAYKECTKSSSRKGNKEGGSRLSRSGSRKGMFNLSCKTSCSVRDDNLVRVSQLPFEIHGQKDYRNGSLCKHT